MCESRQQTGFVRRVKEQPLCLNVPAAAGCAGALLAQHAGCVLQASGGTMPKGCHEQDLPAIMSSATCAPVVAGIICSTYTHTCAVATPAAEHMRALPWCATHPLRPSQSEESSWWRGPRPCPQHPPHSRGQQQTQAWRSHSSRGWSHPRPPAAITAGGAAHTVWFGSPQACVLI